MGRAEGETRAEEVQVGRKVWGDRSICILPDRLFWYTELILTVILYTMPDLPLHNAHKETHPQTTTTTTTTNYTQPCSLSHWTQQVSLSLSQYLSLSLSLFEPSTNSSLRTCTPSYRTTLPLNLVFYLL